MGDRVKRDSSSDAPSTGLLNFYRITSLFLFLLIAGGLGYYEYRQHQEKPVIILVNSKCVATVANMNVAVDILKSVHLHQVGAAYLTSDDAPRFVEDVELKRTDDDAPLDTADSAVDKISAVANTEVTADVILVDRVPVVALPDEASAQATLDDLKAHYVSLPPNGPLAADPTFVQTVTFDRRRVRWNLTKQDPTDAAQFLSTPPPPRTSTVLPHQTGWLIARKFHLSFADFLLANSGTDVNRLSPGDTVIVSRTSPPIDVVVKKISSVNQGFGGTGVRQVTLVSTFVDGAPVGTPIATDIRTVKRATPRAVLD